MRALAAVLVLLLAHVAWAEQRLPAATPGSFAGSPSNSSIISGQPGIIIMFESDAPDPCPDPCTHTLTWITSNTAGATGSQDVGTDFDPTSPDTGTAISGTQDVTATADTVYTLSVPGLLSGPTKQATVSVNVDAANPPPQLFNAPSQNIFDTYDPLCDGTNPEIIFCDGFEDGTWHTFEAPGPNVQGSAADDYWGHGQFLDTHLPDDQLDTDWTDCRTGAIDITKADFGAAGTPCAASLGWVQNQNSGGGSNFVADGHHRIAINGTNPGQTAATGPYDINVRWMMREDGTKSIRCPAGWPNCPAFSYAGSTANNNGYKALDANPDWLTVGIFGPVHGVRTKAQTASGALNLFDFGEFAGCSGSPPANVQELQTWPAGGSPPHLDHTQIRGHYIAFQVRWRMKSDGRLTLWMDDCGEDGRQCTGTPTVRIDTGAEGNIDLTPQCLPNGIRELHFNYYNGGVASGELKIDGIVVRSNEGLTLSERSTPIPFEPNHSGL